MYTATAQAMLARMFDSAALRALKASLYAAPPLAALLLAWPSQPQFARVDAEVAAQAGPNAYPIAAPSVAQPVTPAPVQGRAFVIADDFESDQQRIFAAPGDLAIENAAVTLVVRKRDGWLIDLWHNSPQPSTGGQLAERTHIDGLWQLHTVLHDGVNQTDVSATSVTLREDTIKTSATLGLGAGRVRVETSYHLDGNRPRVIITTKFKHLSGGRLTHLSVGDAVKWGNTEYFVDGKRQKPTFNAKGTYVGRQGGGGDLRLATLEGKPMLISARSYFNGLAGEVRTGYRNLALNPGDSVVVQRALEYSPIPIAEAIPKQKPGLLKVSVRDEAGKALAAKLSIKGVALTPTPNFGNTGGLSGANRFVWSGTGDFERSLPPGKYEVLATAGFEREAKTWQVEIRSEQTVAVLGALPRAYESPGWLSADLHLHQSPSPDADIACATRVISVAAEGVELASGTDHYVVSDLGPSIKYLTDSGQLATPMRSMIGSEISTVGNLFGHFGFFPMQPDDVINYRDTTPKDMFAEMRQVAPKGLIQVNHPRLDKIGYFARYKLDPASMRVPAQYQDEYSDDFDLLEVFNGLEVMSEPKLRKVLFDWIKLLGRGYRYAATGNSDSHNLFYLDPGLPRNFIRVPDSTSDADDLLTPEATIVDSLRAGRIVVSTGPLLEVDVRGKGPGETAKIVDGRAPLHIRIRAPSWIDVDSVEILLGGNGQRVRWLPVKEKKRALRFDDTINLEIPGKTFVVVLAKGSKPLPHTFTSGIKPIAFSNPIWLEP